MAGGSARALAPVVARMERDAHERRVRRELPVPSGPEARVLLVHGSRLAFSPTHHGILGLDFANWLRALIVNGALLAAIAIGVSARPPAPFQPSEQAVSVVFEAGEQPEAAPTPVPIQDATPKTNEPAAPKAQALPPPPRRRPATANPRRSAPSEPSGAPEIAAPPATMEESQLAAFPVVPPRPVSGLAGNREPDYPPAALRRRLQGTVVLRVDVTADGAPQTLAVRTSSGHAVLDEAALAAVRLWRFHPATRGGVPIAAPAEVPIRFSLQD
jgi:protein TonB